MKVSGNRVLITGGSRGIGLALARAFADRGNEVLVVARSKERLDALRAQHPGLRTFAADLSVADELEALRDHVVAEFPSVNVLVNNAAIQLNGDFLDELDARDIEAELMTDVLAPVRLTKLLLPLLAAQPDAAVVNLSSVLAFTPKETAPVYCAAKAFVHSFSIGLRYQLEARGIRVFELIPPLVDTDMTQGRGNGKMAPDAVAAAFLGAWRQDRYQVRVGRTKLFMIAHRLAPGLIGRIVRRF